MLYNKIQHKGWGQVANIARGKVECCICHETTPRVLYFIVQHEYTVFLLICWCCVGGLITSTQSLISAFSAGCFDRMDSQSDADKQTDPVVSPSLLQWEMKDARDFYDLNFDFMQDSEWLPPLTKRKKLSLSLNKGKRKTEDLERALYDSTNTVAVDNTLPTSSRLGSLTTEEQLGDAANFVVVMYA